MSEQLVPNAFASIGIASKDLLKRYWLNFGLIALSVLMLAFISFGVLSKSRPGAMSWGPTVDINAAAIAFNALYTGKMDGLGRHETAAAIARSVTTTGNELEVGTDPSLVANTDLVNQGIDRARKIYTPDLPPAEIASRKIVTTIAEDIGYADFYLFAFRFFGPTALSTHLLFLTILFGTVTLMVGSLWRSLAAMSCLVFLTTAYFAITTTDLFSELTPNLASNRFLSTLIVVPAFHLVLFGLERGRPSVLAMLLLGLQILFFAWILTFRTSSTWALVGLVAAALAISAVRLVPALAKKQVPLGDTVAIGRLAAVVALAFVVTSSWQAIRSSMLDPVYQGTDVLPYHLRWHSAWRGLSEHPNWPTEAPIPELKGVSGDGIGWKMFEHVMVEEHPDEPIVSPITGTYRFRLVEEVLQNATLKFIAGHPQYAAELYGIYKPRHAFEIILWVWKTIPLVTWLLVIPAFAAAVLGTIRSVRGQSLELFVAVALVSGASWAPVIWAYPSTYVMADQVFVTLFFVAFAMAMAAALAWRMLAKQ